MFWKGTRFAIQTPAPLIPTATSCPKLEREIETVPKFWNRGRNAMPNWSLCGRHAGPDKSPTPIFINLDNVLTVERQGDLTTVVMVGGEKVYLDTMPETLIGT